MKYKSWVKTYLLPLFIFCVLTIIVTYPLAFKMSNYMFGWIGDPFLGIWTISWVQHNIIAGLHNLWNANIFYPCTNTLAYSEHLFGEAIVSLPIALIFKNPVLTYNFNFLLSFILSGFGMYLLVGYLANNKYAGFFSGILFAFLPFIFAHGCQIQLVNDCWFPYIFLFLHKFFDTQKYKYLFLFSLFYIIQSWSCLYYALFLSVFTLVFIIFYLFVNKPVCFPERQDANFKRKYQIGILLKLGLAGIIIFIFLAPFIYPYLKFQKETGFYRSIYETGHTDILGIFVSYSNNLLYGSFSRELIKTFRIYSESTFFLGITATLLIILSLQKAGTRLIIAKKSNILEKKTGWVSFVFNFLILFFIGLAIYILTGKGMPILGIPPQNYSLRKPIIFIVLLIIVRLIIDKPWWLNWKSFFLEMPVNQRLYFLFAILGFALSLGPYIILAGKKIWYWWTPYAFLYKFFPGFQGIRAPARFGIFTLLALSVLAGYGADKLQKLKFFPYTKIKYVYYVICFGVLLESLCVPFTLHRIPVGREIPEVYKWLGEQKGDFPIVELPMSIGSQLYDTEYMYYSTYHWKKLANGYSGYFPFQYAGLRARMNKFPLDNLIKVLRQRKIKYIIIHKTEFVDAYRGKKIMSWGLIDKEIQSCNEKLQFVKDFGPDIVYEVVRK
ncbi:MAG: hypothetical protein PHE49_09675 [bacterium]|nr:hypothetical protein [bacterium]